MSMPPQLPMPSNGPRNIEELTKLMQAQANQQSAALDPFSLHGMPLKPDKLEWWAEGAEDSEGESVALVYLMVNNALLRGWFSREDIEKFMQFLQTVHDKMGPIQPPPPGLYVPRN